MAEKSEKRSENKQFYYFNDNYTTKDSRVTQEE